MGSAGSSSGLPPGPCMVCMCMCIWSENGTFALQIGHFTLPLIKKYNPHKLTPKANRTLTPVFWRLLISVRRLQPEVSKVVRAGRLELPPLTGPDPKSGASAISPRAQRSVLPAALHSQGNQ